MEREYHVDMQNLPELSAEEAGSIMGGSAVYQYLMKFAAWGVTYFFNMGVQEGRRMRDQL